MGVTIGIGIWDWNSRSCTNDLKERLEERGGYIDAAIECRVVARMLCRRAFGSQCKKIRRQRYKRTPRRNRASPCIRRKSDFRPSGDIIPDGRSERKNHIELV
jgi:hypothetical protein